MDDQLVRARPRGTGQGPAVAPFCLHGVRLSLLARLGTPGPRPHRDQLRRVQLLVHIYRPPPWPWPGIKVRKMAHLVPLALPPFGSIQRVVELVVPPVLLNLLQSPRLHRDRAIVVPQVVVIDLVNL